MLPCGTVSGEDAFAQDRLETLIAFLAYAVGFEVGCKNGFDVFRLMGEDEVKLYVRSQGQGCCFRKQRLRRVHTFKKSATNVVQSNRRNRAI